jgi:hypothetical protein
MQTADSLDDVTGAPCEPIVEPTLEVQQSNPGNGNGGGNGNSGGNGHNNGNGGGRGGKP